MRFGGGQNILVWVKQEGIEGGAMWTIPKQYGNCTGAIHFRMAKEEIVIEMHR